MVTPSLRFPHLYPIRATRPTYPNPADLTTRIICGKYYESRSITNATVTSNSGNTRLNVIIAFTHTYNKFLPVGFTKWNFAFCPPFPDLFFVSTGCTRVRCFICMQVIDTTPVTCCLHRYWPPVLNRIGTNKSLSWHCRLPHCFTRFRYRDSPESFRTTPWPSPLR